MEEITLHELQLVHNTITQEITVSPGLQKYFRSRTFHTRYDERITGDNSILNIPLLSAILPLAWLTGANVSIDRIDRAFYDAVSRIQQTFKTMYPEGKFTTRLIPEEIVDNPPDPEERYGLTFSGGVDSTYSLITNLQRAPRVIMIFGADLSLSEKRDIALIRETYQRFARAIGVPINFIETNARDNFHEARTTHRFHRILGGNVWDRLQHGLFHAGMTAPCQLDDSIDC